MRVRTFTLAAVTAASSFTGPHARTAPKPARPATNRRITFADRLHHRATPAEAAVAIAHAQIGKPYRWAGRGPDAFDCSGLAGFSWAAAGVTLPRSSSAQYAALARVPLDALRPGDLVFSGGRRVGHVGIYIGDGRMIHAPQTGRRVEIAPLHSNVIGAGRPA